MLKATLFTVILTISRAEHSDREEPALTTPLPGKSPGSDCVRASCLAALGHLGQAALMLTVLLTGKCDPWARCQLSRRVKCEHLGSHLQKWLPAGYEHTQPFLIKTSFPLDKTVTFSNSSWKISIMKSNWKTGHGWRYVHKGCQKGDSKAFFKGYY